MLLYSDDFNLSKTWIFHGEQTAKNTIRLLAASDLGQKPTHFRGLRQRKLETIFHPTVMLLIAWIFFKIFMLGLLSWFVADSGCY